MGSRLKRGNETVGELKKFNSTLDSIREEFIFEEKNLSTKKTGIEGVVYVSTRQGQHAARIKYYKKAGDDKNSASISINDPIEIKIISRSLDISPALFDQLKRFIELNRELLLKFWNEGHTMLDEEVTELFKGLKSL